jgi:dihydrofolate reductase
MDSDRGIGRKGRIPWQIKRDRRFFKALTSSQDPAMMHGSSEAGALIERLLTDAGTKAQGRSEGITNAVIMGRKTWESLPSGFRPLPNRYNLVLSRTGLGISGISVSVSHSLEEALEMIRQKGFPFSFVIGGAEVFSSALNRSECSNIFLTEVLHTFDCDVFLPELPSCFREKFCSRIYEEDGIEFRFKILGRA